MIVSNSEVSAHINHDDHIIEVIGENGEVLKIPIVLYSGTEGCQAHCKLNNILCSVRDTFVCSILGDKLNEWRWYVDIPVKATKALEYAVGTIFGVRGGILKKKVIFKRTAK